MSAPGNLTVLAGLSQGTIPQLLPKFPFRWQQPRCALSLATGGQQRRDTPAATRLRASAGPWPGPFSRYPGSFDTGKTPWALGEGCTDMPLAHRTIRAGASGRAGQHREQPGSEPRSRLGPSVPALSPAHSPRLPGTGRHPTPPRAHWPATPAPPPRPRRLRGRLGPPAADRCCRLVRICCQSRWRTGRPAAEAPPPALIDIIGAQRGRPGCSRGWRAAGPVREPGSGAEAEEKEAKEKGSLEGGSAETQTSTANSPPSSSTHQAAAVAVSRNRELEI